jgi:hypothetical protein
MWVGFWRSRTMTCSDPGQHAIWSVEFAEDRLAPNSPRLPALSATRLPEVDEAHGSWPFESKSWGCARKRPAAHRAMLRGDTRAGTWDTRYRIQFGGACSMSLVDMGRHKPGRSPGPGVRRSLVIRHLRAERVCTTHSSDHFVRIIRKMGMVSKRPWASPKKRADGEDGTEKGPPLGRERSRASINQQPCSTRLFHGLHPDRRCRWPALDQT